MILKIGSLGWNHPDGLLVSAHPLLHLWMPLPILAGLSRTPQNLCRMACLGGAPRLAWNRLLGSQQNSKRLSWRMQDLMRTRLRPGEGSPLHFYWTKLVTASPDCRSKYREENNCGHFSQTSYFKVYLIAWPKDILWWGRDYFLRQSFIRFIIEGFGTRKNEPELRSKV